MAIFAGCCLGHTQLSYECPGCAEALGDSPSLEHWRWFKSRTSSKRIKGLINERLAASSTAPEAQPQKETRE